MNIFFSLLSGLVFGTGLIIGGMTDPAKVIGFLNVTQLWDPSLGLVMAGAVAVGFISFQSVRKKRRPVFAKKMHLPTAHHIDLRLTGGSLLFGAGWGLAGICPGPALILIGTGEAKGFVFFISMVLGMLIFEWINNRKK